MKIRHSINKISLLVILTITLNSFKVQSQTYISYSYLEIISYSIKFTYSSNSYQYSRPYYSDQNILATLQGRFDYYHDIFSTEYYKLKDLTLINQSNQVTLQQYKNQRLNEIYNAGSTWDLSNSTNATNLINYCCEIYSYPTIKSELSLLQSCKTELDRIKYKDPDNYLYSKRYESIMKTLDKLKTCGASEINNLSWEKIELENATTNNSLSTKPNLNLNYKSNAQKLKIVNVSKLSEYTVISLQYDNIQLCAGCWVNYAPNTYLEQNGIKYYLKKAEGIPLSPNKYYFETKSVLSFDLYFDKAINLNEKFNLIEIQGSTTAFNIYNISK